MADIQLIDAQQAHTKAKSNQALLVCAYENEAKCRMLNLDGSISFANFKSRVTLYQSRKKSSSIERDRGKRALSVRQRNIRRKALPTSRC